MADDLTLDAFIAAAVAGDRSRQTAQFRIAADQTFRDVPGYSLVYSTPYDARDFRDIYYIRHADQQPAPSGQGAS